jgi:hypothetical protein
MREESIPSPGPGGAHLEKSTVAVALSDNATKLAAIARTRGIDILSARIERAINQRSNGKQRRISHALERRSSRIRRSYILHSSQVYTSPPGVPEATGRLHQLIISGMYVLKFPPYWQLLCI